MREIKVILTLYHLVSTSHSEFRVTLETLQWPNKWATTKHDKFYRPRKSEIKRNVKFLYNFHSSSKFIPFLKRILRRTPTHQLTRKNYTPLRVMLTSLKRTVACRRKR